MRVGLSARNPQRAPSPSNFHDCLSLPMFSEFFHHQTVAGN